MFVVTLVRIGCNNARKKVRSLVAALNRYSTNVKEMDGNESTHHYTKPLCNISKIPGGFDTRPSVQDIQPSFEVSYGRYPRLPDICIQDSSCE